jgi:hypothetical protein
MLARPCREPNKNTCRRIASEGRRESLFRAAHAAAMLACFTMFIAQPDRLHAEPDFQPLVRPCAAETFTPLVSPLGSSGVRYLDPEMLGGTDFTVFQNGAGELWLGRLDGATGLFRSDSGLDWRLDDGVAPVRDTNNGPEWGVSAAGNSIYYVKRDAQDVMQLWRIDFGGAQIERRQLTFGSVDSFGIRPSVSAREASVMLFFAVGTGPDLRLAWASEDEADTPRFVDDYFLPSGGGRFIPDPRTGRTQLMYSAVVQRDPGIRTQIALRDVETGAVRVITNDEGQKYEPRQFRAPEFGNELLILALVDRQRIAVYRDLRDGSGFWTRIEELSLPAEETRPFLYSIKAAANPGAPGIGGVSWFTLSANREDDSNSTDTAMWVLGLGTGPERLCRRVDAGAIDGSTAQRFEPEPYIGNDELFLIYNVNGGPEAQMNVARTGISLSGGSTPLRPATPAATHPTD